MSCYWDLYCKDCDKDLGTEVNHGKQALQILWVSGSMLISTMSMLKELLGMYYSGDILYFPEISDGDFVLFYEEHEHHDVVVKNEYGLLEKIC